MLLTEDPVDALEAVIDGLEDDDFEGATKGSDPLGREVTATDDAVISVSEVLGVAIGASDGTIVVPDEPCRPPVPGPASRSWPERRCFLTGLVLVGAGRARRQDT